MKGKLKNKKVVYTIIGIVSVLLVMIAVTYAYWLVTKTQTNENVISSACLDISISGEKNDITLTNQFPMSDEDGMKLVPYEFTVTNNCNTSVDYQVALEATGDSTNTISSSAIKVALDDSTKLYSAYPSVETTIDGAYESRKLIMGTLTSSESEGSIVTYKLRIWIDADAPISEMNKTFRSKISVTVGQGIKNPIKEGTLAYSILSNYGGEKMKEEISDKPTDLILSTQEISISPNKSYRFATSYTVNPKTAMYSLTGTITTATLNNCRSEAYKCGKYLIMDVYDSTGDSYYVYEIIDFKESGNYVTAKKITYGNEFSHPSADAGIYKIQDDIGTSYYYRGAVIDNYVEFGTYAEDTTIETYERNEYFDWESKSVGISAGSPMYWRIVRINGDGTIRLIYAGTEKVENGAHNVSNIGYYPFNDYYDNSTTVSYAYEDGTGTIVDSAIKTSVDSWYTKHLETNYGSYIADSIFCNDKSIYGYDYYDDSVKDLVTTTSKPNVENYTTRYAGSARASSTKLPSLKCINKSDRYTVNDTKYGNGMLTKPVGLITADETMLAGIYQGSYLYEDNSFWTMTPSFWEEYDGGYAGVINIVEGCLYHSGGNDSSLYTGTFGVRPVINLKADVEFTGDGSFETPYKIVTE